jgi:hypothetical protein
MTRDYKKVAEMFDPSLAAVAEALDRARIEWFVVAGWALDLYLDAKTRPHKDLEVSVWRDQSDSLFDAFADHRIDQVISTKRYQAISEPSQLDSRGHLIIRKAAALNEQPIDIELFLSARHGGVWSFRKDPEVVLPLDSAIIRSTSGLPILAPHLVLLFKSWFFPTMNKSMRETPEEAEFMAKCWEVDCQDFATVFPHLSEVQKDLLEGWLRKFAPGIPWLSAFSRSSLST